jgi:hypothetical protein
MSVARSTGREADPRDADFLRGFRDRRFTGLIRRDFRNGLRENGPISVESNKQASRSDVSWRRTPRAPMMKGVSSKSRPKDVFVEALLSAYGYGRDRNF